MGWFPPWRRVHYYDLMRKVFFKLHLFGATVAGLFIVILGLTGAVMAFDEELDHLTHPRLFHVEPLGTPLSLAQLTARVTAAFPGKPALTYGLSVAPERRPRGRG